jgi:NAD(P)-dependent dehydrogenase (short-subunit alcohol dehydrogenase family)
LTSIGIGKATAIQYAADNCQRIVIADINIDDLLTVKMEIEQNYPGVEVKRIGVDVRNQGSVESMIQDAVKRFGRIDYCTNVAGIIRFGDTTILSTADFDLVYQVHLRGIFLCTKAEIGQMLLQEPLVSRHESLFKMTSFAIHTANDLVLFRDSLFPSRGTICNVSSEAGMMGNGDLPAYVATKHGVVGLSRSVTYQLVIHGHWRIAMLILFNKGWCEICESRNSGECSMSRVSFSKYRLFLLGH